MAISPVVLFRLRCRHNPTFSPPRAAVSATRVTGGAAWVGLKDSSTNPSLTAPPVSERSAVRPGWTVGGGLETALAGKWSAKLEYLYVDAGTNRVYDAAGSGAFLDFKHEYNIVRLGLNYQLTQ